MNHQMQEVDAMIGTELIGSQNPALFARLKYPGPQLSEWLIMLSIKTARRDVTSAVCMRSEKVGSCVTFRQHGFNALPGSDTWNIIPTSFSEKDQSEEHDSRRELPSYQP